MSTLQIIIYVAAYCIGILVTYGVLCYNCSKKSYNTGEYKVDDNDIGFISFLSFIWPLVLIVIILIGPFTLVKKLALNIKNGNKVKSSISVFN